MKKIRLQKAKPLQTQDTNRQQNKAETPIVSALEQNIAWVEQYFARCGDLVVRRFCIGEEYSCNAALMYLDGMINNTIVQENILSPLMCPVCIDAAMGRKVSQNYFSFMMSQLLPAGEITVAYAMEDGVQAMMNGDAFLLLDKSSTGLTINAKGFPHRDMGEPRNEKTLRGPQEAFVETMRVNTAMLRRRLHTSQLKLEQLTLGT